MSKDVLIAIMMSLVNYLIVTTISNRNATSTQNLVKYLLGEVKDEIILEIKEQGEFTRKDDE